MVIKPLRIHHLLIDNFKIYCIFITLDKNPTAVKIPHYFIALVFHCQNIYDFAVKILIKYDLINIMYRCYSITFSIKLINSFFFDITSLAEVQIHVDTDLIIQIQHVLKTKKY